MEYDEKVRFGDKVRNELVATVGEAVEKFATDHPEYKLEVLDRVYGWEVQTDGEWVMGFEVL